MIHARRAKFGLSRIANELREKGVAEDLVDDAIDKLKETEFESATIVWCKKYKATPTSREEWARQARFLQSRGFGFDVIKKVLNNIEDND